MFSSSEVRVCVCVGGGVRGLNLESALEVFASALVAHLSCHKLGNFKAVQHAPAVACG